LEVEVHPISEVSDVGAYDVFVIGAAAYMFHWLEEATGSVERHREVLAGQPVWLFSSGPLGKDLVDDEGHDVLEVTRPKEFDELQELVHPRGERVFFGA
jgi:menaquinone-dependent protoporphyrinogen oxidase